MSESVDTDIKLDFGSGNVVVLPSRCLRLADNPTDCDLCAGVCPVGAITPKEIVRESADAESTDAESTDAEPQASEPTFTELIGTARANINEDAAPPPDIKTTMEQKMGVMIGEDCIHCGICTAACPVESLSTTNHNPKNIERKVTDMVAKLEGLALGCSRALYGVSPRLSQRVIAVPCLASLSAEMWFYTAALARDAQFRPSAGADTNEHEQKIVSTLRVYLPPLVCDDCPANTGGCAESAYLATISKVESWGVENIELISEPDELDPSRASRLMSTLGDTTTGDKRETVAHLADTLKRSWQSAGVDLTLEQKRKEHLAQKRKQKINRQMPDQNTPRPFGKKSQNRRLLRLVFDKNKELACNVELLCTTTTAVLCTGCGTCIGACTLDSRRKVTSNSLLYFGKLLEKDRPQGEMAAITDRVCCLGCSACVLQCPTGACELDNLTGPEFINLRQT